MYLLDCPVIDNSINQNSDPLCQCGAQDDLSSKPFLEESLQKKLLGYETAACIVILYIFLLIVIYCVLYCLDFRRSRRRSSRINVNDRNCFSKI